MNKRNTSPLKSCLLALCAAATLAGAAQAGPVQQRVKDSAQVRVCVWPDYYGVTFRNPRTQQLVGIDVDLSAELGKDLGVKVQHVDSSFPTLIDDLKADRCDVAMFAVGMLPQRMEHLKFTRPYLQSGIYAVSTKSNRAVRSWADIDKPGVMVAVQAGFMTDYPYSRRLLDSADWATLISPPGRFHVLPYAYAVKPGDEAWLAQMDQFVQRIQKDGRLDAAAKRHGLGDIVVR